MKNGVTIRVAVDRFLGSARCRNPNTRRAYTGVLDRLAGHLDPGRELAATTGQDIADAMAMLWGQAKPATWNRNRAAVASFLVWAARNGYPAPGLPDAVERQPESPDATRALDRAAVERLLTRRDVPLREKTLWRMLYETCARAGEILALDIADLELEARRAKVVSKGGAVEYVYWASGTAHLLPRLLRGRTAGPVFLSERRPGPARRPAARDLCPATGRARLGYDRARVLLDHYTSPGPGLPGWDLHQLRHSGATHLGEANAGLQLIMAKGRWRNPRTAMRYVKPGASAVAEVTELLDITPPRRS
ncbi:tyrosine-type recombinase/integrase [Micromonospora sp. NBC_01412]|uniref:tyrosine-type recombinase/integrase n=1 Tax=Micromonospora sp. NBC_01412 TaxID=2903590 RepID=UPI00324F6C9E